MDWQGQKRAEEIMQWGVLLAAIFSFLIGYILGSFKVMLVVYCIFVVIIVLLVVPDWGFYNRHPLEWLDHKFAEPVTKTSEANRPKQIAPKKSSKASKK